MTASDRVTRQPAQVKSTQAKSTQAKSTQFQPAQRRRASRLSDLEQGQEDVTSPRPASASDMQEAYTAGIDALLDDIDEVLTVNAQEFVTGFVQKGGQ